MTEVSYQNLMQGAQSVVWTLLKNDTTLKAKSRAILSGVPSKLGRQTAFPWIRVKAPEPVESAETMSCYMVQLPMTIEIYATTESNIWEIADRIRYLLKSNAKTFKLENKMLRLNTNISTTPSYTLVDEMENRPVYNLELRFGFKWFGEVG